MLRKILLFLICLSLVALICAAGITYWGYLLVTRDLPNFSSIEDYRPPAVTRVFARDGTLIAEFYKERRYPVKLHEVPVMVRNCFLAAEDAAFYKHPGIDPLSIARAFLKNLQAGRHTQGGSTITQQVVKNLLLTPERNVKRKLKEAILSYRLEKKLSKDGILEIYLNQIFFGNTAYGIKAAAAVYFRKPLNELTLAEAALLAALPKAPSHYSPTENFPRAKRRQRYVLAQMVKAGFITPEQSELADREKVVVYRAESRNIFASPFFAGQVRTTFMERWKDLNLDTDGLEIHTTVDLQADRLAATALQAGLRTVDKRRGWRGPITTVPGADHQIFKERFGARISLTLEPGHVYPAMVLSVSASHGTATVALGDRTETIGLREAGWAKKLLDKQERVTWVRPEALLRVGDVIEVSLTESKDSPLLQLDQTPEIEGALVLLDPHSGRVRSLAGGYDYQRSQFNRVTQALRQPGSAFKPLVYLAAVDGFGYTPSTIVYDTPRTFRAGDEYWTPQNFDEKYMGAITLQTALEHSRNLVSADIVSRIGLGAPIEYAKKLGIRSPLGRNISLSLGTSEMTMLELARAYGVFAANGVLFDSVFVDRITDRHGKVIYDYESERFANARQVIDESSAFLMAHMMKGVIERGTATSLKALGRPVAGKTGTTNDHMDAWFVGFTPSWVCAVWVGFDLKKEIGPKETGGKVAAPIFLNYMSKFLEAEDKRQYEQLNADAKVEAERLGIDFVAPEALAPPDFPVPEHVDPFWVNRHTGVLSSPDAPGAIYQYFKKGTEPRREAPPDETTTDSYLESPDL